jgi:pimeloyl-ACP methyl ester carboxylesterase
MNFRFRILSLAALAFLLIGCASAPPLSSLPPIVFVHGNGDNAGVWITTIWRFESNGWPRDRLFAYDVTYPMARDQDGVAQDGRTSARENSEALAREVEQVLKTTGAEKVILYGNSRGGIAIRNYIQEGEGATKVSAAILGGTPNHGVYNDPFRVPASEFNGASPVLMKLNTQNGEGGDEVTHGVRWLTIRSDHNDKYAQPDGVWIGAKGTPTHVDSDGPALKGAENVVIAGIDHRETAFSPKAFEAAYHFITGSEPAQNSVTAESRVVLDGTITGLGLNNAEGTYPSNLPLSGARIEVFATDPATGQRTGSALRDVVTGGTGQWGPFVASPAGSYEFVVTAPGYAVTHIYRSGFLRSSSVVELRAERIADADKSALSVVILSRPRGYFGVPRDSITLDGKSPPAGIPPGVPGVSSVKVAIQDTVGRAVAAEFNGERIVGRAWPVAENHVVLLELLN